MSRNLTKQELETYRTDGAAVVRHAVDESWIGRLNKVVDRQLATPSKWANDANPGASANRQFSDRYMWRHDAVIGSYIRESGCARLAAQAMESRSARFYFDHLLVKEPGTANPTPWHQDIPYWPFLGKQICSIWLALTPCDIATSSLEFVRGSHLDDKYYMAEVFAGDDDANASWITQTEGEICPDIEANRGAYDIIGYDMQPGDALIFSAWTLHGARGNGASNTRRAALSTRWLGDDAIWDPRPGADPTVQAEDVSILPGQRPLDDVVFPELYRA